MISDFVMGLAAIVAEAALVAFASWAARRSYRRFLQKARGPASTALRPGGATPPLDTVFDTLELQHNGQSGVMLLVDNADAFAARALSTAQAGRSLDLMYYIWRTDLAGGC